MCEHGVVWVASVLATLTLTLTLTFDPDPHLHVGGVLQLLLDVIDVVSVHARELYSHYLPSRMSNVLSGF